MSDRTPEPKLPEAELEVLAWLWRRERATARELREELAPTRALAHSTIVTLLTRLEARGCVTKEKGPTGKAFVYRATRDPKRTRSGLVRDLLDRAFQGSGVALVASLFEARPPSPEDVLAMRSLLDSHDEERASKGTSSRKAPRTRGSR